MQALDLRTRAPAAPAHARCRSSFQDPYRLPFSPRLSDRPDHRGRFAEGPRHNGRRRRTARGRNDRAEALSRGRARSRHAAIAIPHEFSGGQRQRDGSIARALVLRPRIHRPRRAHLQRWICSVQAQIVDLLRESATQKYKLAYLFISHDLKVVRAIANHVIVMNNGKVVEQGPAESIFENPREAYTQALLAAALNLEADETGAVST